MTNKVLEKAIQRLANRPPNNLPEETCGEGTNYAWYDHWEGNWRGDTWDNLYPPDDWPV
jgi:hypothetical protein